MCAPTCRHTAVRPRTCAPVRPDMSLYMSPYMSPYMSAYMSPYMSPYMSAYVSPYMSPYMSAYVSPYMWLCCQASHAALLRFARLFCTADRSLLYCR